jgi:hypothetical protein
MVPHCDVVCENRNVAVHVLNWGEPCAHFSFHTENLEVEALSFFRLESVRCKLHKTRLFAAKEAVET